MARPTLKLVLCSALLALAAVSIWTALISPVPDFQMLFYASLPLLFWVLLNGGIVAGLLVMLWGAYAEHYRLGYYALGAVIALLTQFYLLPDSLGYTLYGRGHADILSHWGYVKTIQQTGQIAEKDWYPGLHILLRQFQALGLSKSAASGVTAAVFNSLLLVGLLTYGNRLTSSRRGGLLFAGAGVPPAYMLFHRSLHPFILSFFLLPLSLTILSNKRTVLQTRLLTVLFSLGIVWFHPLTSLYFMGLVALRVFPIPGTAARTRDRVINPPLLFAVATIWTTWFFIIHGRIQLTLTRFATGFLALSKGAAAETANVASGSALSLWQLVLRGVQLYGPPLAVLGIGALVVSILTLYTLHSRKFPSRPLSLTSIEYVVGIVFAGLFIFVLPILSRPVRAVHFAILSATILIGIALHRLAASTCRLDSQRATQVFAVIAVVLLVLTPLATMNVYRDGRHLTESNVEGTDWYLSHSVHGQGVSLLMSHKLVRYLYGYETTDPFEFLTEMEQRLYGGQESLSAAYPGNRYLLVKQYDVERTKGMVPSQRKTTTYISNQELQRVNSDPDVARIYSSGGYRIWIFNKPEQV